MTIDALFRAGEIAFAIGSRLVPLIAAALSGGADEQAATRTALRELAAMPDLEPVMPKVRAMIIAARERVAREVEPTRETPK